MSRRSLLRGCALLSAGGTLPILAGCGDTSEVGGATDMLLQAAGLGSDAQFTRADVERVPYATIGVRFGNNPAAMIVLDRFDADHRLVWTSKEHRTIITRRGRVMRFIGQGRDVKIDIDAASDPLFTGLASGSRQESARWTLSYPERNIFGLTVEAVLKPDGREKFEGIFVQTVATRWIESAKVRQADWSFENEYLVADDGQVLRSRQYLAPDMPTMEITVLRPATGA